VGWVVSSRPSRTLRSSCSDGPAPAADARARGPPRIARACSPRWTQRGRTACGSKHESHTHALARPAVPGQGTRFMGETDPTNGSGEAIFVKWGLASLALEERLQVVSGGSESHSRPAGAGSLRVRPTRRRWRCRPRSAQPPRARSGAAPLGTRGQGWDKRRGTRCHRMESLDSVTSPSRRRNHGLRSGANAWTILRGASQSRGRGFEPLSAAQNEAPVSRGCGAG
jgi:hypothetical protein